MCSQSERLLQGTHALEKCSQWSCLGQMEDATRQKQIRERSCELCYAVKKRNMEGLTSRGRLEGERRLRIFDMHAQSSTRGCRQTFVPIYPESRSAWPACPREAVLTGYPHVPPINRDPWAAGIYIGFPRNQAIDLSKLLRTARTADARTIVTTPWERICDIDSSTLDYN